MAEPWASVGAWLEHHGLGKHAEFFDRAEIDLEVLALLSEQDLKEIGLRKGPRVKCLHYIRQDPSLCRVSADMLAALSSPTNSATSTPPSSPPLSVSSMSSTSPPSPPSPPTPVGSRRGECAGSILFFHKKGKKKSTGKRRLRTVSAFGKIKITDTSEMSKNLQDPEEPTRGDEWLCGCCGTLNPVDGPDVCVCGDASGKTAGVVLYAGDLQKAADRCSNTADRTIFETILTHGLSPPSKPIAIRFDAKPIPLTTKHKRLGKSAQVKAVNISLAATPRKAVARRHSAHDVAAHVSRVIPITRKPVVSLAEVIAAEESLKQDTCDADKIETIAPPAASQQLQTRADLHRPAENSGDKQDADATAKKAADKKTATTGAAALHTAAVELRQTSDALDAETTRIRRLQRRRALEGAEIRATASEATPNRELAEIKRAEDKAEADMTKVKRKVLNLARKNSLRVAIYYAQNKNCPGCPNPKDLQGCHRYVRKQFRLGRSCDPRKQYSRHAALTWQLHASCSCARPDSYSPTPAITLFCGTRSLLRSCSASSMIWA